MYLINVIFQSGHHKEIECHHDLLHTRDAAHRVLRDREVVKRIELRDYSRQLEVLWDAEWTSEQVEERDAYDGAVRALFQAAHELAAAPVSLPHMKAVNRRAHLLLNDVRQVIAHARNK